MLKLNIVDDIADGSSTQSVKMVRNKERIGLYLCMYVCCSTIDKVEVTVGR